MTQIRAWKTHDDFIVAIDQHCYEMSNVADQPNGVCIYLGTLDEDVTCEHYQELRGTDDLPLAITQKVVNLVTYNKAKPCCFPSSLIPSCQL